MAESKYDIVLEAVHYTADNQIAWVRVYERIGSAFTDRLVWSRARLIERMRAGSTVVAGKRIPLMAGSFEVAGPIRLVERGQETFLSSTEDDRSGDHLPGIPIL